MIKNYIVFLSVCFSFCSVLFASVDFGILPVETKLDKQPDPSLFPNQMRTAILVIAGAMVFLMYSGFLLWELGLSRSKNAISLVIKSPLSTCVSLLSFTVIGFGIMFANGSDLIGFNISWLSSNHQSDQLLGFWFFHACVAALVPGIAFGAMAERMKFHGYLIITVLLSTFIYPFTARWSWGSLAHGLSPDFGETSGFLTKMGFMDFAGSTVIHSLAGATGLAGIIVLGPRKERFGEDGDTKILDGHNLPLSGLGILLIWMGWLGLNIGAANGNLHHIGLIIINTLLSSASGGICALVVSRLLFGRSTPIVICQGILAGLVSVSAGCNLYSPLSAIIIGATGGILCSLGTQFLIKQKLDDVTGATSVHLFCGIWGTIAIALFHNSATILNQISGILIATGSTFVICLSLFKILDLTIGLRATEDAQEVGLDFSENALNAYPDFATPTFDSFEDFDEAQDPFSSDPYPNSNSVEPNYE